MAKYPSPAEVTDPYYDWGEHDAEVYRIMGEEMNRVMQEAARHTSNSTKAFNPDEVVHRAIQHLAEQLT